eukprot:TRINITY_DN2269_c4_g1_i5.p1 TRINITY_DN2269_c4_g1~~TRINITY_DN2269_c4_g1_i5.p1  ORF type:complete len:296 (+),score=80.56 TRINITY_DN2269_c4_g1_i5:40-888(+)
MSTLEERVTSNLDDLTNDGSRVRGGAKKDFDDDLLGDDKNSSSPAVDFDDELDDDDVDDRRGSYGKSSGRLSTGRGSKIYGGSPYEKKERRRDRDVKDKVGYVNGEVVTNRLYVGNLDYRTSWGFLKDHFNKVAPVSYTMILQGRDGRPAGCGIVEMETWEDALDAIDELNDTELDGRRIFVRQDKEDKNYVEEVERRNRSEYNPKSRYSRSENRGSDTRERVRSNRDGEYKSRYSESRSSRGSSEELDRSLYIGNVRRNNEIRFCDVHMNVCESYDICECL